MNIRLSALTWGLTFVVMACPAQVYTIQPVLPSFTRDSNTTFLVDLTSIKTQADYAAGNSQLTLNSSNFQARAGYTGP
ncbi:MAG: hypothetical protein WCL11_20455, partial [Verrucomicrobiota bacterium]